MEDFTIEQKRALAIAGARARLGQQESAPVAVETAKPSNMAVFKNSVYEGAASVPDMVLNAPNKVMNLVRAAGGTAATALGKPDWAPNLSADPDLARSALKKIGLINEENAPKDSTQKVIDVLTRGAVSGAMTGGASIPQAVNGAGYGALASGAAAATNEVTDSPVASVAAGLLAPRAAMATGRGFQNAGRSVMTSALKPDAVARSNGDDRRAVQTLLDEGVNVTRGGSDRLTGRIDNINSRIEDAIQNSTANISQNAVSNRVNDTLASFQLRADPHDAIAAIQGVRNGFLNHPLITNGSIPVQLAQQMKQEGNRHLRNSFGERGNAATEAEKALTRGLKEDIATAVPVVGPLNAREGALLNARGQVENRVGADANKNILGLGVIPSNTARSAAFLADRSALVKSLLARSLYSTGGMVPQGNAATATIPVSQEMDSIHRKAIVDALAAQGKRQ